MSSATHVIETNSFARAGLLGNPSDGYGGKAIAFSVRNFRATVTLTPSDQIRIIPHPREVDSSHTSLEAMISNLDRFGFYGGLRLVKAAIRELYDYARPRFEFHDRNFSLAYDTNIPRSVGLAGSSAIITATLKALVQYYDLPIERDVLATLALNAEKNLLKIAAGLMDRVVQMREGMVYMDFSTVGMQQLSGVDVGSCHNLKTSDCESRLYLAFAMEAAEPTEVLHNRLSERFAKRESAVVAAMQELSEVTEQGRLALESGDHLSLAKLIDRNFDIRASICSLPRLHQQMVQTARQAGGSAKFCGSGGAIVGTCDSVETFQRVSEDLTQLGCHVIRPVIWPESDLTRS